jgi:nucleotide-binding universal stress UspA family protein
MPGISAVSPPISAQPACRQPAAMPSTILDADLGVELAGGEIVEEEQRLGTLHDEIVDAHRNEIDADRIVVAGIDGDLQLGADAVIGRHQDRVDEACGLEVEKTAEAADLAHRHRGGASSARLA